MLEEGCDKNSLHNLFTKLQMLLPKMMHISFCVIIWVLYERSNVILYNACIQYTTILQSTKLTQNVKESKISIVNIPNFIVKK